MQQMKITQKMGINMSKKGKIRLVLQKYEKKVFIRLTKVIKYKRNMQ